MRKVAALGAILLVLTVLRDGANASSSDEFPSTHVTIENLTGISVDGIVVHVYPAANFNPLSVNAPGCEWPTFEYIGYPYDPLIVTWPRACVDPGETIEFVFFVDCTDCPAPSVSSYTWQLQGVPVDEQWQEVLWGDVNCSGALDATDALWLLLYDAGVLALPAGFCPVWPGQVFRLETGIDVQRGDIDCSGEVNPVDALRILLADAGLRVQVVTDCPDAADTVSVIPDYALPQGE